MKELRHFQEIEMTFEWKNLLSGKSYTNFEGSIPFYVHITLAVYVVLYRQVAVRPAAWTGWQEHDSEKELRYHHRLHCQGELSLHLPAVTNVVLLIQIVSNWFLQLNLMLRFPTLFYNILIKWVTSVVIVGRLPKTAVWRKWSCDWRTGISRKKVRWF